MPTTRIRKYAGTPFATRNYGVLFPVRDGLEAHFETVGTLAKAATNLVPGKSNGAIVGAPTMAADRATFSAANYLRTGVVQAGPMSIFAVFRSDDPAADSKDIIIASTNSGPATANTGRTSFGITLYVPEVDDDLHMYTARWDGVARATQALIGDNEAEIDTTDWHIIGARFTNTTMSLNVYTPGSAVQQNVTPTAGWLLDPNTKEILVGSRYANTGAVGTVQVNQVSLFSRSVTDQEAATHAAFMVARAALYDVSGL